MLHELVDWTREVKFLRERFSKLAWNLGVLGSVLNELISLVF